MKIFALLASNSELVPPFVPPHLGLVLESVPDAASDFDGGHPNWFRLGHRHLWANVARLSLFCWFLHLGLQGPLYKIFGKRILRIFVID
jgi:hypothetical protein